MPILPLLLRPQRRHIQKIIHATRDKGHARRLMANLLARLKHFMDTVSPFPGNGYGTAKV